MANIFDVNKDITKDDLKKIKNELKRQNFDSTEDFLTYALAAKILDPTIKISIAETNVVNDIKELIETFPSLPESFENENSLPLPRPREYETLYSAIAGMKIIDPTLKLDTGKIWDWATKLLAELKTNKDPYHVQTLVSLAFYMKIIDPSLNIDEIIGGAGWENIKKTYSERKVIDIIDFASKIKALNPKIDLMLNEKDWKDMKEDLLKAKDDKYHHIMIYGIAPFAATMKILAADKVVINENGLEII